MLREIVGYLPNVALVMSHTFKQFISVTNLKIQSKTFGLLVRIVVKTRKTFIFAFHVEWTQALIHTFFTVIFFPVWLGAKFSLLITNLSFTGYQSHKTWNSLPSALIPFFAANFSSPSSFRSKSISFTHKYTTHINRVRDSGGIGRDRNSQI